MNANKKTLFIALATLVIGFIFGWLIYSGPSSSSEKESLHQHNSEMSVETIWTCSMHPQIRQNEPGNCPICGMELIPLESDQGEVLDPLAVSMSPTAMQLANVQTMTVSSQVPEKTIRLNGKVQPDERLVKTQPSHIPGRVERLVVNFTGAYIKKGQTIAYIYSPELVTAQEELFEAQKIKDTQPQLFNASKEKLKNWKLSDQQIEEVLESGSPLETFAIKADISGYVIEKMVQPGDYIRKGEALYELVDLSRVWVLLEVYESDMAWVDKGDVVDITLSALPGEDLKGTISYLDPVIDPKTRVAMARVVLSNREMKLRPEMFVSASVKTSSADALKNIIIPKSALMWTGTRSVVYVKSKTQTGVQFRMREVTTGPDLGGDYIIYEGLQEGEEIAVNGTFSIDAAAQLAGKPSMMKQESNMNDHEKMSGTTMNSTSLGEKATEALEPLYQKYLDLKDALSNDDFENAKSSASGLKDEIENLDHSLFDNMGMLKKHLDPMSNLLTGIQDVSSIKALRTKFITLSNEMIGLAKTYHPMDKTFYVQFCPMADNNKGASWLSVDEKIRNPYFGQSMHTCGNVTEKL